MSSLLLKQPITEDVRATPAGMLVTLQSLFTPDELDAIESHGESLRPTKADIDEQHKSLADQARITRVAWIKRGPQAEWLHSRIEKTVLGMNSRFYGYDLDGLKESFQYTVYKSAEGGHYNWHVDTCKGVERKLSLTLQLSDPWSYEGGDLLLQAGEGPFTANKTRGALTLFPSYMLHRVTPVTAGIRKSLVVWVAGPPYR